MRIEKRYYTVNSKETVELMVQHIEDSSHIAVDTETTGLNVRKDRIVGWSVSGEEGVGFYLPVEVWNPIEEKLEEQYIGGISCHSISEKLFKMLIGKKLVAHNFSFDGRFIKNFYGIDLIPSIWVDTGMLVHTLKEEGAFGYGNPFGLKPIAIMHQQELGLDVEQAANQEQLEMKESIKRNGGSTTKDKFEIYKADLDILSRYGAADTDLTLRICNLYLRKLKEEGLEQFFFEDEVMPIYREVTIPMEEHGVSLDMELLEKTKQEIIKDLEENKKTVLDSLMRTDEARRWVVDTAVNKFPPSNKGNYAQELCKMYDLPLPRSEKTQKYSLTVKTLSELCKQNTDPHLSPILSFLSDGNIEHLGEVESVKLSMSMWKKFNDGEYINVQSKKHLGEIIFDYFGEKALSQTEKGQDQFNMDMIEHLSSRYEWAENLRVYNKLLKIKSTYIDRFLDGQEDGVYYPYFKQNGTVSGRYGSDLQQLPKPKEEGEDVPLIVHYNNLVRAFFVPRKGNLFIDDDYSSLEPRIFSAVAGDEGLKDIYRKGWDFYSTIAIRTEKLEEDKVKYPNGVSPDTKSPVFLKKIDAPKRNKAKSYSLGIPYGLSAFALAKTLDITQKEAQILVDGYLNGFPQLKEWMGRTREFIKENGYIKNKVGRVRHLPLVKEIYGKFGDRLMDFKFRKQLADSLGSEEVQKLYMDYKNQLNNGYNFQIQSMGASICGRAALGINRRAKEMGIQAQVILQVHDQLVIEVEEGRAEEFAKEVQYIMENTITLDGVELIAEPQLARNLVEGH